MSRFSVLLGTVVALAAASRAGGQVGETYEAPATRYETAAVGVAAGQTARLSVANHAMPEGLSVVFRFIDASGRILAASDAIAVRLNETATFDLPQPSARRVRLEVRGQVEVRGLTDPRYSVGFLPGLEVFGASGRTAVRVERFIPTP